MRRRHSTGCFFQFRIRDAVIVCEGYACGPHEQAAIGAGLNGFFGSKPFADARTVRVNNDVFLMIADDLTFYEKERDMMLLGCVCNVPDHGPVIHPRLIIYRGIGEVVGKTANVCQALFACEEEADEYKKQRYRDFYLLHKNPLTLRPYLKRYGRKSLRGMIQRFSPLFDLFYLSGIKYRSALQPHGWMFDLIVIAYPSV